MKGISCFLVKKKQTNEQKRTNRLPYISPKESRRETILMFYWKKSLILIVYKHFLSYWKEIIVISTN